MRPSIRARAPMLALAALMASAPAGCGEAPTGPASAPATAPPAAEAAVPQELNAELTGLINDRSVRFKEVAYDYAEDLLEKVDATEAYLAGKAEGPAPRHIPKLDERDELDHFRETIRRWEEKRGQTLRDAIDSLKGEVAARGPGGPQFHPEFQKRFSAVFDDFVAIEVREMRERRNRAIHEGAAELFEKHRAEHPAAVAELERALEAPEFAVAPPTP